MRQWPSKDFGTFIDHFGAFTKKGITKEMYQALAMSFFGTANYEPDTDLWWQNPLENSTGPGFGTDQTDQKYVYPLPLRLANLLLPGDSFKSVDYNALAHPSFLQRITTDQFIKMFKFGLWAEYQLNASDDFTTLSDVVKAELDIFSKSGINLREDFKVNITFHPYQYIFTLS